MDNMLNIINQATQESIQSVPKNNEANSNIFMVWNLANSGLYMPPWWSPARDRELRRFWKKSDHLSGALYTMEAKMAAIPFEVVPMNRASKDDIETAKYLTDVLWSSTDFGAGWTSLYPKFNEELLSQDNGVFLEVIGPGSPNGPIIGTPTSLAHLDSSRCTRTGVAEFPVIYEDVDGRRYKLHYSRVMFSSQMSSPMAEMFGIGFCAISRAINVAQNLMDIIVYKQEKLGSRPHRQLIITKGGLDPNDLASAFQLADTEMDSSGLSRYSKIVVGGSSTIPDAGLDVVELSKMPDGFDEQTSTDLGMATIALAFGVDAKELFPSMQSGATRADALLQHLKQRGKGPGQILQITEQLLNFKFLPYGFKIQFDFQDDAEDRQRAEIRKIRADRRVQDMSTGTITERILREQMVEDGEVSQEQFERMEMESGRLADGNSSLLLFFTNDSSISKYLKIDVENPLDVRNNDPQYILDSIEENRLKVNETLANTKSIQEKYNAMLAQSALNELEVLYAPPMLTPTTTPGKPGKNYIDPRVRTQDVRNPTQGDRNQESNVSDTSKMPPEDEATLG